MLELLANIHKHLVWVNWLGFTPPPDVAAPSSLSSSPGFLWVPMGSDGFRWVPMGSYMASYGSCLLACNACLHCVLTILAYIACTACLQCLLALHAGSACLHCLLAVLACSACLYCLHGLYCLLAVLAYTVWGPRASFIDYFREVSDS